MIILFPASPKVFFTRIVSIAASASSVLSQTSTPFPAARPSAFNLLRIPFPILAPAILIFSTIGAYALRANILDVYSMFGAGIVGFFMRRGDYSIPAVVMGVILGQIGENVFSQAMVIIDYNFLNFFTQPISGVLITGGLATIAYNIFKHSRRYFSTYGHLDETTSRESGD